jgi:PAS domain S-box-containing protein
VPVLRVATPIHTASGEVFGLIVINTDMAGVLGRLHSLYFANETFYLANGEGDYLLHPDGAKAFGFERGTPSRLQLEFPDIAPFVNDPGQREMSTTMTGADGRDIVVHLEKLEFGTLPRLRHLIAAAVAPVDLLMVESRDGRLAIIPVSGALALIATVLALLAARLIVRPLRQLTGAAEALAQGKNVSEVCVPSDRSDEVGALARSFHEMALTLEWRTDYAEEWEQTLQAILEAAMSPIITIDGLGKVQQANSATTAMFGYSREELVGSNVSMLMREVDRNRHDGYLATYLNTGERRIIGVGREVYGLRKDGTEVPVHLAVGEVRRKGRRLYTGILTDLTELKKVERLKSDFVSTVSHELRTPLTSIKGALGLLRSAALGELAGQARMMVDIAYNNRDRLVRLINDILDIEKIEAGKLSFEFQLTGLAPFLARAIEANRGFADDFGVRLELADVDSDLEVETDPDRLMQVMTNLLSNAAKFSPEGGVVTLEACRAGDVARISVTDRGGGIPQAFQETIFGRFSQADTSDTKDKGGTGLGLAITKAIVEAHGGTIGFRTAEGAGTTFHIELPIVQRAPGPMADAGDGRRPRVLICEDDQDTASLLYLIIQEMGYDAEICASAKAARECLRAGPFAAMTLDLVLPDEDGISLIRELRRTAEFEDLPILVVSAWTERGQEELAGGAFAVVDWLEKPIDLVRLRSGIGRAVHALKSDSVRILHVEDEEDHLAIVSSLVGAGAIVDCARTCEAARRHLAAHDYDLVILDLVLPDGEGDCLLPLIRGNGSRPPQVLVFSTMEAPDTLAHKVDTTLVKSRTSNEVLRRQIHALLGSKVTSREVSLAETGRDAA